MSKIVLEIDNEGRQFIVDNETGSRNTENKSKHMTDIQIYTQVSTSMKLKKMPKIFSIMKLHKQTFFWARKDAC